MPYGLLETLAIHKITAVAIAGAAVLAGPAALRWRMRGNCPQRPLRLARHRPSRSLNRLNWRRIPRSAHSVFPKPSSLA